MKCNVLALLSCLLLLNSCSNSTMSTQGSVAPDGSITYQTFYDDLSPYGSWIDYPEYGNVWSPNVDGDFRPYATNGHWVYSNEGWMWNSYYNWGWAPFHYGRWIYDDVYGWLWIPGYDWSPAWVTWGYVDDYYCWAPLMPGVGVGAAYGSWHPHSYYWNIVPRGHLYDNDLGRVIQHPGEGDNLSNRIAIYNNFNTTHVHNQYYAQGPNVNEVEKYTNRTITPMNIRESTARGNTRVDGNNVQVYRPKVSSPEPRQYRQIQNNNMRPIQQVNDRPNIQRSEQIRNVNSLPMRTAPMPSGGGFRGVGTGRVRR